MKEITELINEINLKSNILSEKITSEEILLLLDMIYIETNRNLQIHKHHTVLTVLIAMLRFDAKLQAEIFIKMNNDENDDIFYYLELHAQVNTFRNKILEDIIRYLCDRYEHSRLLIKLNSEIATQIFEEARKINDFYLTELKLALQKENIPQEEFYRQKPCKETISALEDVFRIALKSLIRSVDKDE